MKNRGIVKHILFWLIYYLIEFSIEVSSDIFTKTSIIRYFLGLSLFYIFGFIFNKENLLQKINLFILSGLAFFWLSLIIKYGTLNLNQNFTKPTISVQILYVIDNFIHLFFIAFIFNIYKKMKAKHEQEMQLENQLYEIETLYLNSKIDNHFFRNSINVFYAYFLKTQSKTAQNLIKLADFVKKHL